MPNAMKTLLEMRDIRIDGLYVHAHVSTVIGVKPYHL
jgi:hydrogenase maturation factor